MLLFKRDGNVYFLREIRLCCQCYRMFCLNDHSYVLGWCGGKRLWQHLQCPPAKKEPPAPLLLTNNPERKLP